MSELKRYARDFDPSTLVVERCKYMQAIGQVQDLTAINAAMLEALKQFVDAMRAGVTKQEIMASIDAADKNARSVLAKATGEQQ